MRTCGSGMMTSVPPEKPLIDGALRNDEGPVIRTQLLPVQVFLGASVFAADLFAVFPLLRR
jgi:hypothetical protein